jgi:hypothetical protein
MGYFKTMVFVDKTKECVFCLDPRSSRGRRRQDHALFRIDRLQPPTLETLRQAQGERLRLLLSQLLLVEASGRAVAFTTELVEASGVRLAI